jgi:hypothetical protein
MTSLRAICFLFLLSAPAALANPQPQSTSRWVPFSAKHRFTLGQEKTIRHGTFSRGGDGSTRGEKFLPRGEVEITIRSAATRMMYLKSPGVQWLSAPLSASVFAPPSQSRGQRPGWTVEETKYEGHRALRLRRRSDASEQILLPEFDFFPAVSQDNLRRDEFYDIRKGNQPKTGFDPPEAESLRFRLPTDLYSYLRRKRQ